MKIQTLALDWQARHAFTFLRAKKKRKEEEHAPSFQMGAYLSEPATEATSSCGAGPLTSFGTSSMQGWRRNMEDGACSSSPFSLALAVATIASPRTKQRMLLPLSLIHLLSSSHPCSGFVVVQAAHVCEASFKCCVDDAALYAVFDGHGGAEVADYCARHFAAEVGRELTTRGGCDATGSALTEVFLRLDRMLISSTGRAELQAAQPSTGAEARAELQLAVQAELAAAKAKGSLSRAEAASLAQKMMRLERMPKSATEAAVHAAVSDLSLLTEASVPCRAGCTAVATLVLADRYACANAGDSRCVLCNGDNIAVPLSHDHKPTDPIEKARIEAAGGWLAEPQQPGAMPRVCGNLNLSRSIGDLKFKLNHDVGQAAQIITANPDVIVRPRDRRDRFLILACDGVWDVMTSQDAVDFVVARIDATPPLALDVICEEMMMACLATNPAETRGIGCVFVFFCFCYVASCSLRSHSLTPFRAFLCLPPFVSMAAATI